VRANEDLQRAAEQSGVKRHKAKSPAKAAADGVPRLRIGGAEAGRAVNKN
jgi:hypothetical protein